jgi:hypothetical protein
MESEDVWFMCQILFLMAGFSLLAFVAGAKWGPYLKSRFWRWLIDEFHV